MSKRPFRLVVQWQDRKWGPQIHKTAEEATSIRRAINQALKAFFGDRPRRKERLDAHASLSLSVQRMKPHGGKP
jgi:hypothetical protein